MLEDVSTFIEIKVDKVVDVFVKGNTIQWWKVEEAFDIIHLNYVVFWWAKYAIISTPPLSNAGDTFLALNNVVRHSVDVRVF